MSLPTFIVFLVVLFVGVPSALRLSLRWQRGPKVRVHGIRNATALGLVVTWFAGQAVYQITGQYHSFSRSDVALLLFFQDLAVIPFILLKAEWRDDAPYVSPWQVAQAIFWRERSPWDKIILALYPLAWLFYLPIVGDTAQYWTLYGIGLAQLMLAGREALDPWLRRLGQHSRADDGRPPGLSFAAAGGGYG